MCLAIDTMRWLATESCFGLFMHESFTSLDCFYPGFHVMHYRGCIVFRSFGTVELHKTAVQKGLLSFPFTVQMIKS